MNHETRIKTLEKKVDELSSAMQELLPKSEWIPLSEAAKRLEVSNYVIWSRIKNGTFKHKIDYIKVGKRYKVNFRKIREKIS
jgi:hypothetical protein